MQKSMFLNKKIGHSTPFIEIRNGCHQRGRYDSEKHQTFEFSLLVEFLCILNIANFEIFWKIHKCAS